MSPTNKQVIQIFHKCCWGVKKAFKKFGRVVTGTGDHSKQKTKGASQKCRHPQCLHFTKFYFNINYLKPLFISVIGFGGRFARPGAFWILSPLYRRNNGPFPPPFVLRWRWTTTFYKPNWVAPLRTSTFYKSVRIALAPRPDEFHRIGPQ